MNTDTSSQRTIPGGYLIAFEGIDGSGKTTAARNVTIHLQQKGFNAVYLREPTDGPHGRRLRQIMVSPDKRDAQLEFELFLLDRQDDVEHNIKPVLQAGGIVCIDRYYVSSMAYQGALGIEMEEIRAENERIAPPPDLILRFVVDIDTALARIHASRTDGANQFEKKDYLKLVNSNFERMNFPQMVDVPSNDEQEKVLRRALEIVASCLDQATGTNLSIV